MSLNKLHVKKGDTVLVLSGKDKGKQGKILQAMPAKDKVVVEGVNKIKRHTKPNQKAPNGGIIEKEAPMFASKVQACLPLTEHACINYNILSNNKLFSGLFFSCQAFVIA